MPVRSNACSELTRFWLQARHGCLVDEGVPVVVPRALSDIDLVAVRADMKAFPLPDGTSVGPRVIVETKDEHDWDSTGREFGQLLRVDLAKMASQGYVPKGTSGVKFTMLRQEHYECAVKLFGNDDFDRVFVVHALERDVRAQLGTSQQASWRIHWVTIPEIVADLLRWYRRHPRPAGLRQTLVGDLIHLLVGFCKLDLPASETISAG